MDQLSTQKTDEELALLLQQGHEEALSVLIDRYDQKLLRYGRKFLSNSDNIEDIVQDVFIKVYQNIKSFNLSQRFSPWIYRIAHNAFVDQIRRKEKEPLALFDFDTLLDHHVVEDPAVEQKEKEEMNVLLEKGLDKLNPLYREVIVLHYFENLGYQEIADVLHIPIGTVGIRLKRAREALKKHIPYEQQF
ncbi:MAG: RNA polymerase sigma factor [Candidatus Pacebacteria bacterium]|nr:RNA polymerase sigma factor [Candidatus Paceibacterota bacterium]